MALVDERGKFARANAKLCKMLGYSEPELRQITFSDITHPDDRGKDVLLLRRLFAGDLESYEIEKRYLRQNGEELWVRISVSSVQGEGNRRLYGLGLVEDITDRKRTEQSLLNAQLLYRTLVESLPIGFFAKDLGGRFTYANTMLCQSLQKSLGDIIGKTDFDFFPHELALKYTTDDKRVIQSGLPFECSEVFSDSTGKKTHVRTVKTPVRDSLGQIVGIQGGFFDLTDQIQSEEKLKNLATELERSNRDLEQFASVASHDLLQPLRTISTFTGSLERNLQGRVDSDSFESLAYIRNAAQRMQWMIRHLLDYSRIGVERRVTPTDCNRVLATVQSDLHEVIRESRAVVTSGTLPLVYAEPIELGRLFQNLIHNAIKFRGTRVARIHIDCHYAEQEWHFTLSDNGIGIASTDCDKIFKLFSTLSTGSDGGATGSGIGLAVCKKIVEFHGGRIWVESQRDQGSVFHFTIPAQPPEHTTGT